MIPGNLRVVANARPRALNLDTATDQVGGHDISYFTSTGSRPPRSTVFQRYSALHSRVLMPHTVCVERLHSVPERRC